MRWSVIFLTLLAGACSGPNYYWTKTDFAYEQFHRDNYACIRDGYGAGDADISGGSITRDMNVELYQYCMVSKGYHREPLNGSQASQAGQAARAPARARTP